MADRGSPAAHLFPNPKPALALRPREAPLPQQPAAGSGLPGVVASASHLRTSLPQLAAGLLRVSPRLRVYNCFLKVSPCLRVCNCLLKTSCGGRIASSQRRLYRQRTWSRTPAGKAGLD